MLNTFFKSFYILLKFLLQHKTQFQSLFQLSRIRGFKSSKFKHAYLKSYQPKINEILPVSRLVGPLQLSSLTLLQIRPPSS